MFRKNDLVICKPEEEKRNENNRDFEVYARVVDVKDTYVYLDRYLKMGAIHRDSLGNPAKILITDAEKYYQPMNDEEKKIFAKTLLGLEQRNGKIHFSANNVFEGWEKITPVLQETMDFLRYATKEGKSILYDCYDENENPIGIIFAKNCKELLEKNPNVKYVRGMDAVTRLPKWHEVTEAGLVPYQPKVQSHREESNWSYDEVKHCIYMKSSSDSEGPDFKEENFEDLER